MSYFYKICLDFLIFGLIWQLIMIQRVNSLEISDNKEETKLQVTRYLEHLNKLKAIKGVTKYFQKSSLKKQSPTTDICQLGPAQLLTLCQDIATSEQYRGKKFVLVRLERFTAECFSVYFLHDNERDKQNVQMVTCPYIKQHFLEYGLKDNKPLSSHPGVLFVSGNLGPNSGLVFITRIRNKEVTPEPYGHVTGIDMVALKKVKKLEEATEKAIAANVEIENLNPPTDDSDENVEPPLRFRDLL